jgi:hypothetical protein
MSSATWARVAIEDLTAGLRHFLILARITARDPVALGILIFAGIVTIPAWTFGLGIDLLTAASSPGGPAVATVRLMAEMFAMYVLAELMWALIVVAAVARTVSGRAASGTVRGRGMPALPIGPRARVAAEAFVAVAFVVIARVTVLILGGEPLARRFIHSMAWGVSYPAALAGSTLLGALFVFPMVLCWTAVAPYSARGLAKMVIVTAVLLAAGSVGAMTHPRTALLVSVALSALVLVRLDDGNRPEPRATGSPAALHYRRSPGPQTQFRRDAWLAPARTLWPLIMIAVPLPFVLSAPFPRSGAGVLLVLAQVLVLSALPFFPLGLKLVPSVAGSALFSGYFLRAWSPLPVPREQVIRATFLHGVVTAGIVWLVLCVHVLHRGGGTHALLFELPSVFLVGGIVVCEAVGDRRRGLLAVAALVGFHMVVPLAYVFVQLFGAWSAGFVKSGTGLTVEAYALGLLGGIPPLVHLRARSRATAR